MQTQLHQQSQVTSKEDHRSPTRNLICREGFTISSRDADAAGELGFHSIYDVQNSPYSDDTQARDDIKSLFQGALDRMLKRRPPTDQSMPKFQ